MLWEETDMRSRVILAIATLLLFSIFARAQKPVTTPPQKGNDHSLEQLDRLTEVSIMPVGYSRREGGYVLKQEFRTGEPIRVALLITNRSNETLVMDKGDRFFHYRLRLLKEGKEVEYLEDVKKSIDSKDEYGPNGLSPVIAVTLEPNKQTTVEYIDLAKWYGPLDAGHYELTLGHRFHHKGPHVQSNATAFDVVP
jgi:hypothetical protein